MRRTGRRVRDAVMQLPVVLTDRLRHVPLGGLYSQPGAAGDLTTGHLADPMGHECSRVRGSSSSSIAFSRRRSRSSSVGAKEDRRGRYLLIDEGVVLPARRMDLPHDFKVSHAGVFVIIDRGLRSDLAGTFHAFGSDGANLVVMTYSANILNGGISRDGGMAACRTCNSPGRPTARRLRYLPSTWERA